MIDKVNVKYYDPDEGMELVFLNAKELKKGNLVCDHVWAGTNFDSNLTPEQTRFVYGSKEYNLAMAYASKHLQNSREGSYISIVPRK